MLSTPRTGVNVGVGDLAGRATPHSMIAQSKLWKNTSCILRQALISGQFDLVPRVPIQAALSRTNAPALPERAGAYYLAPDAANHDVRAVNFLGTK